MWPKGKTQPFSVERGYVSDKRHMPAILDFKSPTTPRIVHFPATLSFEEHIKFSKSPSQQKVARRTEILSRGVGEPASTENGKS